MSYYGHAFEEQEQLHFPYVYSLQLPGIRGELEKAGIEIPAGATFVSAQAIYDGPVFCRTDVVFYRETDWGVLGLCPRVERAGEPVVFSHRFSLVHLLPRD